MWPKPQMLTPAKTQFPESCSRRRIWASLRLRPRAVRGALGQEPPRQPLLLKGAMQSAVSFSCHEEHELHVHGSSPCTTPSSASLSPSAARLWRPAAQRNLRNQWSKLLSSKKLWESGASEGRSNATALVNAYLSRRYMPNMNLGVLKDMPEIRQKAGEKLARKQEQCQSKLLSSYKDLVKILN
ncbi:hypothetical protein Taro_005660 [Colocasia esculenta]|uniref:Uncharacterized protein n=1 Tax=Colocasia esculenta TaxID=4460 RepID=A0A843TTQ5_COLES|nr:hypothetical protein [Colocasia esculenta]